MTGPAGAGSVVVRVGADVGAASVTVTRGGSGPVDPLTGPVPGADAVTALWSTGASVPAAADGSAPSGPSGATGTDAGSATGRSAAAASATGLGAPGSGLDLLRLLGIAVPAAILLVVVLMWVAVWRRGRRLVSP